jgi:protein-disulfide isomerase
MNRFAQFSLAVILLTSISALAQTNSQAKPAGPTKPAATSNSSLPSEATVSAFLKAVFGWNQELTWKIAEIKPSEAAGISQATVILNTPRGPQTLRFFITSDQKYAFPGELMPFGADPFGDIRQELKAADGPTEGPKNAAVTIVEFGDLECPACKAAQPNIAKLMQEEPKAKLIFENYPLETIHKWSMTGAKYLDCMARENNDAAVKFIATVYDHQAEVNDQNVDQMLKGYVKEAGGDPDKVATCAANPETEKRVRESMKLGEKLDVSSTPTFFIDGRRLVGFSSNSTPYDVVKAMTDYAVANAK